MAQSSASTPNTPASLFSTPVPPSAKRPRTPKTAKPVAALTQKEPGLCFPDADILIKSPTGMTWKLHAMMLSRSGSVWKKLIGGYAKPIHITKSMREEGNIIQYKFEMCEEREARVVDPNGLVFRGFRGAINNKFSISDLFASNLNGLGTAPTFDKHYENFFRALYNIPPIFTNDIAAGASRYILDCTTLLQVAVFLDAVPCVRVVVEAYLLRLNQVLWQQIAQKPEGWIHLAAQLHSPSMFREAMLHIVGKFHLKNGINEVYLRKPEHGELGQRVWDLIVSKARELKVKKLLIERQLLEYFPERMIHPPMPDSVPGRAIYAGEIYYWQALTLVRQYISSAYLSNYHHRAKDGGLAFYRCLNKGEFLRKEQLEEVHRSFDMSSKGRHCLREAVEVVKIGVSNIVGEVLGDESLAEVPEGVGEVERGEKRVWGHFTCTVVLDEEMPWLEKPVVVQEEDAEQEGAVGEEHDDAVGGDVVMGENAE